MNMELQLINLNHNISVIRIIVNTGIDLKLSRVKWRLKRVASVAFRILIPLISSLLRD